MKLVLNVIRYVWRFGIFFVSNCYGLFGYVMWTTALLPLRILWPAMFWKIESHLFRTLQSCVILWIGSGGYCVIESGDDICKLSEEEVLLLANHQSTADTPLVMMALWGKGHCMGNSLWIMDWIFRFTNFGIISSIRRDVFIKQGKETREQQTDMLRDHLKRCYVAQRRRWIILFPEGGFLRNRLESSQSYARKNGYPVLHNVTLPRIGALQTIIDSIGEPDYAVTNGYYDGDPMQPTKWLVDLTIGYRNKEGSPPDMFGMCVGYREVQNMYVHYRAYPLSMVPHDSTGLLQWVYRRFEEKDQLLEHLKEHGHFPAEGEGRVLPNLPPQQVMYDWINIFFIQGFYIASAYLHYKCVVQPLWSMLLR